MPQTLPHRIAPVVAVLAWLASACAVDGLLLTEATRKGQARLPAPAPQSLTGKAWAGAQVSLQRADGKPLAGPGEGNVQATAAADGRFLIKLDGATALANAFVEARQGRRQALGLVPELPAQVSVLQPARTFDLVALSPGAHQLDVTTTTLALLLAGKLQRQGSTLAVASPSSVTKTLIQVHGDLLKAKPQLFVFAQMIARIDASAQAAKTTPDADLPFDVAGKPSHLRLAFLQAVATDVDGDGAADATTAAFDAALASATDAFAFDTCYPPATLRAVFLARLSGPHKDGNCEEIDAYKAAKKKAGSTVFFAGGIRKDTPACSATRTTHCLLPAQVDAANALLGNWTPNKIAMFDDGTHGDATSGDGVWTVSFDLPWWDASAAPDLAGVRIGYKFTFGSQGQGWTDSEEFSGNERMLELVDVNGDHRITRFDAFADETTNKEKANLLSPAKGGCGHVTWPQAPEADCSADARERPVDLDGDCAVDGWPQTSASPLTMACDKK